MIDKSQIELLPPEPQPNSELKVDATSVRPACTKPHVVCCTCEQPLLICPPYGYCYNCESLRVPKISLTIEIPSYNIHEVERVLFEKQKHDFPLLSRSDSAKMLGYSERQYQRKLTKYKLRDYRMSGKGSISFKNKI